MVTVDVVRLSCKRKHNDRMLAVKCAARRLGVSWADICEERDRLRETELGKRDYLESARRTAWESFCGYRGTDADSWRAWDRKAAFWRNGFQRRFARRLAAGSDYTTIPRHDEIVETVRCNVPELANDSTDEIWALLLSPYEPRTRSGDLYDIALANVLLGRASVASITETETTPF